MIINALLGNIVNGKWFMEPQFAMAHMLDVQKLLDKEYRAIGDVDRAKIAFSIYNESASHHANVNSGSGFDSIPKNSTLVVSLKGPMLKEGTLCSYGTEEIAAEIIRAGSHKNINSVVIDINSGGGAVDSVAPLVFAIKKVENEFGKPVVASADLCASAGYWTASACSRIVANNNISAHFGSIGVMCSFMDMQPVYEQMGAKFHTIYSKHSTHKNVSFQKALEGKYDLIKSEELDPLAIKFQNTIKENRADKLKTDVQGILSGRMFFAEDALKYGLIDQIGSLESAVQLAQDLALTF